MARIIIHGILHLWSERQRTEKKKKEETNARSGNKALLVFANSQEEK